MVCRPRLDMSKIKDIIDFFRLPIFRWVQVEISSHCRSGCLYCPRSIFKESWSERLMPPALFRELLPALKKTALVYLQGWGEPFTNPDILEMIRLAHQCGCRVGTSTNGMLLESSMIEALVAEGIEVVAFSLAGLGHGNDTIRQGTSCEKVMAVIRELNEAKKRAGTDKPAIHIAYMLLDSGMGDLEKIPAAFEGLGISQVVISTLDYIPDPIWENEAIAPRTESEYNKYKKPLDKLVLEGRTRELDIYYRLAHPGKRQPVCTERVTESFFVSSDGSVSPCVFTSLPLPGDALPPPAGAYPFGRLVFGNINTESIIKIWKNPDYKKFRQAFRAGRPPSSCLKCRKLYMS